MSPSLCLNSSASFTPSGAISYTWDSGSTLASIFVTPSVSTDTVTGKNNLGCAASATSNVHVWQPPVIGIAASSMTLCAKETVTLNATGASSYTWYPFSVTGPVLINAASNTLQYSVIGIDINGCSKTSVTVTVDKCTGIAKKSFFR